MGKALYRKYRSRRLSEIVGQSHVTDILSRAIETGNTAHAYLFTGPRGTGKTSIARIMAHEINKLPYDEDSSHLDIIEIDAASNNGVDDIRDLREKVQLAPSMAKKKVYIIDEVHMLSKPAFNALLKTLEEPPEHVVFILATTDVDKLPDTIISRTQRYSFKKASAAHIIENLHRIAKAESITIDDEALQLIAEQSGGSYRDSVSLLDQLQSTTSKEKMITGEHVTTLLGLPPTTVIDQLLEAVAEQKFDTVITAVKELDDAGTQPRVVAERLIQRIIHQPDRFGKLFPLIHELLLVASSPLPEAKLISVLGVAASKMQKPASVPLQVTSPKATISAIKELPELSAKATEPHPKDDITVPTPPVGVPTPKKKSKTTSKHTSVSLDWPPLITSLKETSIALYSVLTKCDYMQEGAELTLYCKNEFYKKKLDSVKFRQHIIDALKQAADIDWEIITIPGSKPSDNSHVAAVAAMMGGGEEVSVDSL